LLAQNGGATVIAIGNRSALIGGGYSALPTLWTPSSLDLFVNGGTRLSISSAGVISINAPSSGSNALVVSGSVVVNGPAPAGVTLNPGTWSFETPVTRIYVGDGSGYTYRFSKRAGAATTDLITRTDSGITGIMGVGGAPAAGVPLSVTGSAEILRLVTTTARGSGNAYLSFVDPTGTKGFCGF